MILASTIHFVLSKCILEKINCLENTYMQYRYHQHCIVVILVYGLSTNNHIVLGGRIRVHLNEKSSCRNVIYAWHLHYQCQFKESCG